LELNQAQIEAVRHTAGPLLVLAGAGSGKTRVITGKIVHLLRELDIAPCNIAAVTFTNKAAREMRGRVAKLVDESVAAELTISTFHTLGLRIIGREHEALGCRRNVSIFDQQDGTTLLREFGLGERAESALWRISSWKGRLLTPEEALHDAEDEAEAAVARAYARYDRYLRACNAVDFDDLIALPVRLFRDRPDIRDAWSHRLRWLLVDEYQDTNAAQYELLKMLAGPRANLTAVGDDDQSIYAWRGAQPENLAQLATDYPQLKVVKLEQNYRSSQRILSAANALIARNSHLFEKKLWSALGHGDRIEVLACDDGQREAERVVMEALAHHAARGHHWRDYAILYRSNHQARAFERVLREHRIPYRVSGGTSFFDRAEVRDLIAYLRLLVNPDDDTAFLRVANTPRREIGAVTLERLGAYAAKRHTSLFEASFEMGLEQVLDRRQLGAVRGFTRQLVETEDAATRGDPVDAIKSLIDRIGYRHWLTETSRDMAAADRRMETVNELVAWMERIAGQPGPDRTLADLAGHMSLMDMLERDDDAGDQLSLMTLHAAKGLEFPFVFLTGVEEGLVPHRNSIESDSVEEERRLMYVGITRAQRRLWISYAQRRKRHREVVECEPSRFLFELPEESLEWARPGAPVSEVERKEKGRASIAALRGLLTKS
jgi:ATP-dependent DNA helicase Rep